MQWSGEAGPVDALPSAPCAHLRDHLECLFLCLRVLCSIGESAAPCTGAAHSGRRMPQKLPAVGVGSTVDSSSCLPGPQPPSLPAYRGTILRHSSQPPHKVLRQLSPDNPLCSSVLYFLAFLIVPSPSCVPGITCQKITWTQALVSAAVLRFPRETEPLG